MYIPPCTAIQGGDTTTEVERVLIEEVHDAVFDLVELIKTYHNKNKLAKVLTSTLFKRRQDELDAVVDRAVLRLHVSGVQPSVHASRDGGLVTKGINEQLQVSTR